MSIVNNDINKSIKRVIIAGGGTGGHIFPAIAIAHALKKANPLIEILFVGAKGKMEMEKVPQAGFNIKGIDIAGLNRSSLIKNIGLPWKLLKSFFQVRSIFAAFAPNVVIGVGGYSSFPVLRYAQSKGIPTYLHESNAFAGKTNIMLAKKATQVYVATEDMEVFFPKKKIVVTGNPIRSSIEHAAISKASAVSYFGLNDIDPVVLIIGGSLGARSINEAIAEKIPALYGEKIQVIWQTGTGFVERAQDAAGNKNSIKVFQFITEMEKAYAAADIVVSRAGAMAISEMQVLGKPAIFVPYPFAAEDHQTKNARKLVDAKAGEMVPDRDVKQSLVPTIIRLVEDKEKQQLYSNNIKSQALRDAATTIATLVLQNNKN